MKGTNKGYLVIRLKIYKGVDLYKVAAGFAWKQVADIY